MPSLHVGSPDPDRTSQPEVVLQRSLKKSSGSLAAQGHKRKPKGTLALSAAKAPIERHAEAQGDVGTQCRESADPR